MSLSKLSHLMDPISASLIHREYSIFKPSPPPCYSRLIGIVEDELGFALDLVSPKFPSVFDLPVISPLDFFESAADLVQIDRAASHFRRLHERAETELHLRSLSDRVAALELGFDLAMNPKLADQERKYKWTAEIKGPKGEGFDRKYKLTAVKGVAQKNVKWTAEITGKGKDAPLTHTYTFQASTVPSGAKKEKHNIGEMGKKEASSGKRVVEIEEPVNRGAIVLKQAVAKRAFDCSKGKRKELSPQDAALIIQMSFRAHLVRRSQVLRGLRDLAVAKAKLKEIRALFSNYSYRRRIEVDAEERQRFSEKIVVLLLTVDAIEGLDYIIRAAKRSMVVELEGMLEVVDPQPYGKLGSIKRRQFDLPTGGSISKEMAMGVAEVVQMLDEEDNHGNALSGVSL
ncbi:putative BAG domain-containing protein [Dioscorea sansibarensis]